MSNDVLVIITETNDAGLAQSAVEALGAASDLAGKTGGNVSALVTKGSAASDAGGYGPSTVHAFEEAPSNEGLLATASALIAEQEPAAVIVNRGPVVLELVPRLAARTSGASVTGVVEMTVDGGEIGATAAVFGGAALAQYKFDAEGPVILTMAPGAVEQPEQSTSSAMK